MIFAPVQRRNPETGGGGNNGEFESSRATENPFHGQPKFPGVRSREYPQGMDRSKATCPEGGEAINPHGVQIANGLAQPPLLVGARFLPFKRLHFLEHMAVVLQERLAVSL